MTAKRLAVLILVFLIGTVHVDLCRAASKTKPKLLRDGFVLNGIDGELTTTGPDGWFFKFDVEVADDKARIEPGKSLRLLPSSTLEKMTAAAKADATIPYRLWGRITRYRNENLIFPVYFLPLSKAKPAERLTQPPAAGGPAEPSINEPGDAVIIPDEVLQMLRPRRVVALARLTVPLDLQRDSILADRTGFIVQLKDNVWPVFELDSLGRNLQGRSVRLMPCQALQHAQAEEARSPARLRFKVAGILTKYKGRHWLLLQRATRLYSHGNFGR